MSLARCFDTLDDQGRIVCSISADPDEPGAWTGTCQDWHDRQQDLAIWQLQPKPRGPRPETRCKHIYELHERAKEHGRVNVTRHRPTPAGIFLSQHCRCGNGGERALDLYTPPPPAVPAAPPPAAGAPSRNRPCPCGSLDPQGRPALFKWCHGAAPGDPKIPADQLPWPSHLPPLDGAPAAPPPPAETPAAKKKRETREASELTKLEKARADRIRADEARAKDEARRAKRAEAETKRRAARKAEAAALAAFEFAAENLRAARKAARLAERAPRIEYAIRRGTVRGKGGYYTPSGGWSPNRAKAQRWPTPDTIQKLAARAKGRIVKIKVVPV